MPQHQGIASLPKYRRQLRSSSVTETDFTYSSYEHGLAGGRDHGILPGFYRRAAAVGYAPAEPFTCRQARGVFGGERLASLAVRRRPEPHVTARYPGRDFAAVFARALAGPPPGGPDEDRCRDRPASPGQRGPQPARQHPGNGRGDQPGGAASRGEAQP